MVGKCGMTGFETVTAGDGMIVSSTTGSETASIGAGATGESSCLLDSRGTCGGLSNGCDSLACGTVDGESRFTEWKVRVEPEVDAVNVVVMSSISMMSIIFKLGGGLHGTMRRGLAWPGSSVFDVTELSERTLGSSRGLSIDMRLRSATSSSSAIIDNSFIGCGVSGLAPDCISRVNDCSGRVVACDSVLGEETISVATDS